MPLTHSFSLDDAASYGVEEAIMLNTIRFWIAINTENGTHQIQGRTWMFNSAQAFTKTHPYWTPKQIRRILASLVSQKALVSDQFGGTNRSAWYSLAPLMCRVSVVKETKASRPSAQMGKSLLGTNSVSNTVGVLDESLPENLRTEAFAKAWAEWTDERRVRRKPMTPRAAQLQLQKLSSWGSAKAVLAITTSISNSWSGIFEPDETNISNHTNGSRPLTGAEQRQVGIPKSDGTDVGELLAETQRRARAVRLAARAQSASNGVATANDRNGSHVPGRA